MLLHFLGNGSAFTSSHTNAFFYDRKEKTRDLYFLDLSMLNIRKAWSLVTDDVDQVYVLLTHMHDDHCSGIGIMAEWLYLLHNKKLYIVADRALYKDITVYMKVIGVREEMYQIILPEGMDAEMKAVVRQIIPTVHTPLLDKKCFGFHLSIQGTRVIFTGDTATLETFLPYITDGCELYSEISYYHGGVHLFWQEQKQLLLTLSKTCSVFLMHLDAPEQMKKEVYGTNIQLAEVI